MEKYSWSFNEREELFTNTADTIDECIEQASIENEGYYSKVYIGENVPRPIALKIDTERIIEDLDCYVEDCAPWSADMGYWSNGIKDKDSELLDKLLNEVFQKWLKETENEPDYWEVVNVKKYNL